MDKFKEIRPIVLGIAKRENKILVSEGYDEVTNEVFYRSIGGGIEFLENSKDALKREFKEELNIDISVGEFLGIAENIFTYNGKKAHELILFYKEKYHAINNSDETSGIWIDINKFKNKELKMYPEQILEYLN